MGAALVRLAGAGARVDDAAGVPGEAEALQVGAHGRVAAEDVDAADDGRVGGHVVGGEAEREAVVVAGERGATPKRRR